MQRQLKKLNCSAKNKLNNRKALKRVNKTILSGKI